MSKEKRDPAVAAFTQSVMERLGLDTAYQFQEYAVGAGWMRWTQVRKVARWATGESAPSHRETLLMLRAAGMLNDAPAVPGEAERAAAAAAPDAHRDELLESMGLLIGLLREVLPQLRKLPAAPQRAAESPGRAVN